MQWLQDPSFTVEEWQIEDLRHLQDAELFDRLQRHEIWLDPHSFVVQAEEVNTPEDLSNLMIGDRSILDQEQDQIYLLIFELWRRFLPERKSLTIFCDELDHYIWQYDHYELDDLTPLEQSLDGLAQILKEGTEDGHEPLEVFEAVACRCANDLESFLFDYINDRIDEGDFGYANRLLDSYIDFMSDTKWFHLLKSRIRSLEDPDSSLQSLANLIHEAHAEPDMDFLFELLLILVEVGDDPLFFPVVQDLVHQIRQEDQFQEILQITYDYFQRHDRDDIANEILKIIETREHIPLNSPFSQKDPVIERFYSAIHLLH
jgi:hypothetical protein